MENQIIATIINGNFENESSKQLLYLNLYEANYRRVKSYIKSKVVHEESVNEILNDTFIVAFGKLNLFNPEKGKFSYWLCGIAKHKLLDYFAAQKKYRMFVDIDEMEDIMDPMYEEVMNITFQGLTQYLNEKEALILNYRIQGLNYEEIAQLIQTKENACRTMVSRVYSRLRNIPALSYCA